MHICWDFGSGKIQLYKRTPVGVLGDGPNSVSPHVGSLGHIVTTLSVIGLPNRGREVASRHLVTVFLTVRPSMLSYVCLSFFPLEEMPSCAVCSFFSAGLVLSFPYGVVGALHVLRV